MDINATGKMLRFYANFSLQGVEIGRPGFLQARTEKKDGEVSGVWIGGIRVSINKGVILIFII